MPKSKKFADSGSDSELRSPFCEFFAKSEIDLAKFIIFYANEVDATSSVPDFDSLHSGEAYFLAVWPGDLEEHWALCHMIQGFCHMCKVPKNRLSVTEEVHDAWRADEEKQRYEGKLS